MFTICASQHIQTKRIYIEHAKKKNKKSIEIWANFKEMEKMKKIMQNVRMPPYSKYNDLCQNFVNAHMYAYFNLAAPYRYIL